MTLTTRRGVQHLDHANLQLHRYQGPAVKVLHSATIQVRQPPVMPLSLVEPING